MKPWDNVLWLTGFALNLGLLCVLLQKRRFQKFPWFTLLIAQDAAQTIVLFLVHGHPRINFYTYWSFEALDALLRLLVLYEVARVLLAQCGMNLSALARRYWSFLVVLVGVLVAFALLTPSSPHLPVEIALRIGQMSSICVGGVISLLILGTFFFGLRFRIHAQAVLYGLALYMFGKLWVHTLLLLLGDLQQWSALEVSLKPVYHLTLLIWIACLWFEEPEVKPTPEMQQLMHAEPALMR
jgi:multidrug transporter EmrE-like cation transporter